MKVLFLLLMAGMLGVACRPKEPHSVSVSSTATLADTLVSESETPPSSEKDITKEPFDLEELFRSENSDVVNALASQEPEKARKKALHYLKKDNLSPAQRANLRYMHLYSVATLVAAGQATKSELSELISAYSGEELITQHLPITPEGGMPFNQIQVSPGNLSELKVSTSDPDGFHIIFFLNLKLQSPEDLHAHLGKRAYLGGVLQSGESSPADINSWIGSLEIHEAYFRIMETE